MKKFMKIFACVAMALIVPFGLVGCDKEQLEENTKTVIESGATIIPVEYKQETAEAILKSAIQKLLSSNQSQIIGRQYVIDEGLYEETISEQRVLIQNGKRYLYFDLEFEGSKKAVIGEYDGKRMFVNLEEKTFFDISPKDPSPEPDPNEETATAVNALVSIMTKLDLVTSMVTLSENVVAGRYFDGATYINVKVEDSNVKNSVEFKIVDGLIISVETIMQDISGNATGWAISTVNYGATVDTSVIPTSLIGYTNAAN